MKKHRKQKDSIIPPVTEGQRLTLSIEGLNHEGEGVGHFEGFTIFVPDTVPGDLAAVKVISLKKTYGRALVEETLEPSTARIEPRCRHHAHCGGCQLQHLTYQDQLIYKRQFVLDSLQRLGGLQVPVLPVLGMADPWGYRNKAQIPVSMAEGKALAGFYRKRSHAIVDINTCPVQAPANDEVFQAARIAIEKGKIPVYNEGSHSGILRHVVSRTSIGRGEVLIVLVTNGSVFPGKEVLVEVLTSRVKNLVGIVQNVNSRRGNAIFGRQDITLWGRPYIEETLGNLTFRVSPQSFFQVNTMQTNVLYEKVKEYAELSGKETIFDLYSGTGTIGLYLSPFAHRVIGVESVGAAVEDARQNAHLNGITNAEFFLGRAEDVVPKLLKDGHNADVVVVDPPRGGCEPALLETISVLKPERIVYVSCTPATLARDLKYLKGEGFAVLEVQPVDMFPHTAHVECAVSLVRK